MNEGYIALLAEGQDDIWHPETYPCWETLQKTVDAEELLVCPWPPEDRHEKPLTFLWTLMDRLLLLWWCHMSQNC